ncbi:MAG: L,D-transpeptidase family protein [Pseudomonadota bacterium]
MNLLRKISLQSLPYIFVGALLTSPFTSEAHTYALPQGNNTIIGEVTTIESKPGDTLRLLTRRYDIGFQEIQSANPDILPEQRLLPGTKITLPSQFILPPKPWNGVIINLSAYRIFYFPEDMPVVMTFPIGIGKEGLDYQNKAWDTPTFDGYITTKFKDPSWYPPESVRVHTQQTLGLSLPRVMPPSIKNPLGQYKIYTSKPGYLLHGTNYPYGVGDQVSAGCLRMLPEDVEQLYYALPDKTPLRVFRQPFDVGILNQRLYMEAHPKQKGVIQDDLPLSDTSIISNVLYNSAAYQIPVNWDTVYQLIYHRKLSSIPVNISRE